MTRIGLLLILLAGLTMPGRAQTASPEAPNPQAVVVTDAGTFRFELFPGKAPKHVAQFIKFAEEGYYDGSAFHRIVSDGLIQGGDPLLKDPKTPKSRWGTGGMNLLTAEPSDLKHERGTVSTVRTYRPDSDGSQFFVCLAPQAPLDGNFTAFGRITEGIEVVEKISRGTANENNLADQPVRIQKVTIQLPKTP